MSDFELQSERITHIIQKGYHLLSTTDKSTLVSIGTRLIAKLAREEKKRYDARRLESNSSVEGPQGLSTVVHPSQE